MEVLLPAEVVFKVETKHFYCKFYCHPVEVFLMRFAGRSALPVELLIEWREAQLVITLGTAGTQT